MKRKPEGRREANPGRAPVSGRSSRPAGRGSRDALRHRSSGSLRSAGSGPSSDAGVSSIVGFLILVAIVTSFAPGLVLMLDDGGLPPDGRATWTGLEHNGSTQTYRLEVDAIWGTPTPTDATIVLPTGEIDATIETGSTIEIPCVGADPSAALVIEDQLVSSSELLGCRGADDGSSEADNSTSYTKPLPPTGEEGPGCRLIEVEHEVEAGRTISIEIRVCSPKVLER